MSDDLIKRLQDRSQRLWVTEQDLLDNNLFREAYGCIKQLLRENASMRKANSDMGWRLNPDRMGGQFTEEEVNRGNEWR
jgi:hypothetical protein